MVLKKLENCSMPMSTTIFWGNKIPKIWRKVQWNKSTFLYVTLYIDNVNLNKKLYEIVLRVFSCWSMVNNEQTNLQESNTLNVLGKRNNIEIIEKNAYMCTDIDARAYKTHTYTYYITGMYKISGSIQSIYLYNQYSRVLYSRIYLF